MESPFVVEAPHPRFFHDDHCANCLVELPVDEPGLFCSTWCAEIATQVRYLRRVSRDGRIDDPDVQLAVRTRNAFLLIGGYRSLGRKLTPRLRELIRERDGGLCRLCGKPGIEVDHVGSNSDDPDNLQLLCLECHRAKTAENFVPAGEEDQRLLRGMMRARVQPAEPQLAADDEVNWSREWRSLQRARKDRFLDLLRDAGVRVRRDDSHAERVRALREAQASSEPTTYTPPVIGREGDTFFHEIMRDSFR